MVSIEFENRLLSFSKGIIQYTNTFPKKKEFWNLSDQLLRSSTSVGANVFEAKSSSSKREFIRYFEIALRSANETKY